LQFVSLVTLGCRKSPARVGARINERAPSQARRSKRTNQHVKHQPRKLADPCVAVFFFFSFSSTFNRSRLCLATSQVDVGN
jgi:hypothetical protein